MGERAGVGGGAGPLVGSRTAAQAGPPPRPRTSCGPLGRLGRSRSSRKGSVRGVPKEKNAEGAAYGGQESAWRRAQVGEAAWRLWARAAAVTGRRVAADERECVVADRVSRESFCGEDGKEELEAALCCLLHSSRGASIPHGAGKGSSREVGKWPPLAANEVVLSRLEAWAEAGEEACKAWERSYSTPLPPLKDEDLQVVAEATAATLERGWAGGRAFKAIHSPNAAAAFTFRSLLGHLFMMESKRFMELCITIERVEMYRK